MSSSFSQNYSTEINKSPGIAPSENSAETKELNPEISISNENRKSPNGIECQNCYEVIRSSPHIFELHIKSCKIYYKYMERKSDGFQCKLCSYFSAKRFEMNMHLKRSHKTVKISDEEPNQQTNVSKLSNSGEGLLAKKFRGPTSSPVAEQVSSPDSGQAFSPVSSSVSEQASGKDSSQASSPDSGQASGLASSSFSEQASSQVSSPASGQASSLASSSVSEQAFGHDSCTAFSTASGQLTKKLKGPISSPVSDQVSSQVSSSVSEKASGPESRSIKSENSVGASNPVFGQTSCLSSPKNEDSNQKSNQNSAFGQTSDQNSIQASVQTSGEAYRIQLLQQPQLPSLLHKPKIIPGIGTYWFYGSFA